MKLFLVLSLVICVVAAAAEEMDLESIEILSLEENETPISKKRIILRSLLFLIIGIYNIWLKRRQ